MGDAMELAKTVKVWEELYLTSAIVMKAWEIELTPSGLTLPQALVLYCLVRSRATPTLQELAQMMCREPHSISALASGMEADGLVRKRRDPRNSRQTRVSLTKRGREIIQSQLTLRATRDIIRTVSEEELDTLHSICDKMRGEAFRLIREIRPTPYDVPLD
jgi:MarR family transcriptional regulator, organic hydroperoxide resistance regulator